MIFDKAVSEVIITNKIPLKGRFEIPVCLDGYEITVQGIVIDNTPRVTNMWIASLE